MSIFKRLLFALISALTLYIVKCIKFAPKKKGGGRDLRSTYALYQLAVSLLFHT